MGKKNKKGPKSTQERAKEELQGIFVPEPFTASFHPFSQQLPSCLMPLMGVPLIDYTLEALDAAHVKELFVVLTAPHHDKVVRHLRSSGWLEQSETKMSVQVVHASEARSFGDCMRQMVFLGRVSGGGEVIVAHGCSVGCDLKSGLARFREVCGSNKETAFGLGFVPMPTGHPLRHNHGSGQFAFQGDYVVACTKCDTDLPAMAVASAELDDPQPFRSSYFPAQNLFSGPPVQVSVSALQTDVSFWKKDHLTLWGDYFDCRCTLDLTASVIDAFELQGLYVTRIQLPECVRVDSLDLYLAAHHALARRLLFPLVPEQLPGEYPKVSFSRRLYRGDSTRFGLEGSYVGDFCSFGAHAQVGDGCLVERSYIGASSVVCDGAEVSDSVLLNGVVVHKGCVVRNSVVGARAVIGEEHGMGIVLQRCHVAPNVMITSSTSDERICDPSLAVDSDKQDVLHEMDCCKRPVFRLEPVEFRCEPQQPEAEEAFEGTAFFADLAALLAHSIETSPDRDLDMGSDTLRVEMNSLRLAHLINSHELAANTAAWVALEGYLAAEDKPGCLNLIRSLIGAEQEEGDSGEVEELTLAVVAEEGCRDPANAANAIYQLYDKDIVGETAVFQNHHAMEDEFPDICSVCEPFISWLREAPSDDEPETETEEEGDTCTTSDLESDDGQEGDDEEAVG